MRALPLGQSSRTTGEVFLPATILRFYGYFAWNRSRHNRAVGSAKLSAFMQLGA